MDIVQWRDWPHVVEMQQFSASNLEEIVRHTHQFEEALTLGKDLPRLSKPKRRRLRTLFYQASTRTEGTFLDAAELLGFSSHAVKNPKSFSSAAKGESFAYALAAYTCSGGMGRLRGCDCVVIRHEEEGTALKASKIIETSLAGNHNCQPPPLPVINAGDGSQGQHPTQSLVDLATIGHARHNNHRHFMDDIVALFPGELHRSRVINSLLYAFGKFGQQHKIKAIFCCPTSQGPKPELLQYLQRHHVQYEFVPLNDFRDAIKQANVIYMTRPQTEYKNKKVAQLTPAERAALVFRKEYLGLLQDGAIVMHPLPINDNPNNPPAEIDPELAPKAMGGDKQCVWLQQSHRGLPTRAALLDLVFAGIDAHDAKY